MRSGLIDGAALLEVVASLDQGRPERCSRWAWATAVEATVALVVNSHLWLSPIPVRSSAPAGAYGRLLTRLAMVEEQGATAREARRQALAQTRAWGSRNPEKIIEILNTAKADESYPFWIDWLRRNQWPEHATRHTGLIDPVFLKQIAKALSMNVSELSRVTTLSHAEVNHLAKAREPNDRIFLLQDAFTISTILRGVLYDRVVKIEETHVLHHPIRDIYAPLRPSTATDVFAITNTEWWFANILLSCALNSPPHQRIEQWAANILSTRAIASDLVLNHAPSEEKALLRAAEAARRVGFDTNPRWVDKIINDSATLGIGVLTSFFVDPITGFSAGVTYSLLSSRIDLGRNITQLLTARPQRLARMARACPGRIRKVWVAPGR